MIDVKEILNTLKGDEEARKQPISISVYLDDSSPADIIGQVRSLFASAATHVRVTLGYLGNAQAVPNSTDDAAIIVASVHEDAGKLAAQCREAGVPTMVVSTTPSILADLAKSTGYPIPESDIIAPIIPEGVEEPIDLNDEIIDYLKTRMGEWIIANCEEKCLAFATAFPFVCRPLGLDAVNLTSIENGIIGALVFIPVANWPIMTLNQVKMVIQIAAAYGLPLTTERIKELVVVCLGGYGCRAVARSITGTIPFIGPFVNAGVGFGGTQVMGRAALEYFENGAGLAGLGKTVAEASEVLVDGIEAVQVAVNGEKPEPEPEPEKSFRESASESAKVWSGRAKKFGSVAAKVAIPLAATAADASTDSLKSVASSLAHKVR